MDRIKLFDEDFFYYGRSAINDMIPDLSEHVKEEDRELFAAYVNAIRGMNLMSARHDVKDDYETKINLGDGNGSVSVGGLLQNVNTLNGSETEGDYSLDGQYPTGDIKSSLNALLPDDANGKLAGDVVTLMGNFEQLLGMLQRVKSFGKDTKFTNEALSKFGDANGLSYMGVKIDKMSHEITEEQEQGL